MQGLPFDSEQELLNHLETDMGLSEDKAEEVAQVIIDEAESDEGNPQKLLQSIKDGAKNILSNLGLETVSWVENPSQDSMFVMMKNSENRIAKQSSIYKEPEENWETVYGPVMRPNDIDKDGDIAPAHDIKKAAHEFMADGKVKQFDQDHDLNTGKGTLVESWILKEDKEYELPNGETETIEEGSWMVGVQPNQQVKERIQNGEITGWSIFGQADQIELKNSAQYKSFNNSPETNSVKDDTMGENQSTSENNGQELSLKDVHNELTEFKQDFQEYKEAPNPSTVKSMEELEKHVKSEENNVIRLGKEFELETQEKEMKAEDMSELMDMLEEQLPEDEFSMLVDAVRGSEEETVEEETDEDEDEKEKEKETAKHKQKQVDTQVEKDIDKNISFQKRAEEYAQN